jgi:DNA-binding NarL/FixJ family response regulator
MNPKFRGGLRSVLVVDDNPKIRRGVCEAFTREVGFDVCSEAEDGRDAIEKAQRVRPSLVIMDLSMPVLNGLEATRRLKQLMPTVPVILYSIHGTRSLQREAVAAGAAAAVSKAEPISVLIEKARLLIEQMAA